MSTINMKGVRNGLHGQSFHRTPMMGRSFLARQISNVTSFATRKLTADVPGTTDVTMPAETGAPKKKSSSLFTMPVMLSGGAVLLVGIFALAKRKRK